MLVLLSLTSFHGLTMLPGWEAQMGQLAQVINDSGQLLWSFSIGLVVSMIAPILVYMLCIWVWQRITQSKQSFRQLFSGMAFLAIPLAFSYHLAHNLNHLLREGSDLSELLSNPLGQGALPLSSAELHARHMSMWLSQDVLFAIQAGLMVFGMWIAVKVIRHRAFALMPELQQTPSKLWPVLVFVLLTTALNTWLLAQPMVMRM